MDAEVLLICGVGLMLSALMTGVVRKIALSFGVLDIPNERSSHTRATPRGGGASIVIAASLGIPVLAAFGRLHGGLLFALLVGGVVVAGIGFMDDRWSVPAGVRFAVHLGAALLATESVGGLPSVWLGDHLIHLGWWGHAPAILGIAWAVNLFNFMDGIDGIAGAEAVFILVSVGVLGTAGGGFSDVSAVALLVGAACIGFLIWNWPPASIFMGDVGSGYLGYVIGVLGVAATRENPAAVWLWLILGGAFFVDATLTLGRRLARGDRVYVAHRSHAYQWLARRWGSHGKVTITVMAVNLVWLLPCCRFAILNPQLATWIALVALIPVVFAALAAGAGRQEQTGTR